MALVVLATLLLLVSGAAWFAALMSTREARLDLERRLKLATGVRDAGLSKGEAEAVTAKWLVTVGQWLRSGFAFRIPRQWGMRLNGYILLLIGFVAGGLIWLFVHYGLHLGYWIAVPLTAAAFGLVPRFLLKQGQNKVEQEFLTMFPDAIDMAVRMLRAGLPISSAIRTIATDTLPPVRDVFGALADQLEIGIPFDEALDVVGNRIGLADFRFFAVAVSLQHATGGNLAATLEILSDIMRRRRAARLKAVAATGEVRASAYVLGFLPFLVTGALLVVSPNYLRPLLNDPRGNVLVGAAVVGLLLGVFSMRRMMRGVTQL